MCLARFCSSSPFFPLQPPEEKKRGTQPCLGKLVKKLGDFSFLLALEPELEPRNSPPCRKLSDLLCPSSPVRRLFLLVGCDLLRFWVRNSY
ncbi:hypothetical protein SLEP1_g3064 [Rubroshorea leprosula]|uniref:Uncharacterized protein n=1 Tax=Rubroshorea leprosula TaxID=152421 RepID=A0AAV5HJL5_9ROSI|nr:hypothetical protein SLEP1_g3064 [Rubroshorea leprosula]